MFAAERMASKKKTQSVQQQYRCVLETKVEKLSCGAELHIMMAPKKSTRSQSEAKRPGKQQLP